MAKRKPRTMPTAGFYVMKPKGSYSTLIQQGYKEAIYTTGVRGGGGHKYCRCIGNVGGNSQHSLKWVTLLWSCVHSAKELAKDYDYYPTYNAIPQSWGFPKP